MAFKKVDEELDAKKQTSAFMSARNQLMRSREDLSEKEIEELALEEVNKAVFGFDYKRDRKGNPIQQGIGSPGHETTNHFTSIRKYEGKDAWEAAVKELWNRDPDHAKRLGLPKIKEPE